MDHLQAIAFETLPKTFQDAIEVARAIGLRFLWIDSLCIVQDDTQDWLDQSAVMGSIYERARVTIAASGAENPSEGCFLSTRPTEDSIVVPYYSESKERSGLVNITPISPYDSNPLQSSLKERGWAFQEWRLSRRMVHFTKGGISWQCKKYQLCERGVKHIFQAHPTWDSMVYDYTGTQLTYETDRLIALQGLVNEMQKTRMDLYHAGIWESDLPGFLLWMPMWEDESDARTWPTVPSWSWVSQPGTKIIWSRRQELNCRNVTACKITTESPGTAILELEAPLKQCILKMDVIPHSETRNSSLLIKEPEADMAWGRGGPIHYIQNLSNELQKPVGMAILDFESDIDKALDICCLFLASTTRPTSSSASSTASGRLTTEQKPPQHINSGGELRLADTEDIEEGIENLQISEVAEKPDECTDARWVLLLEPIPDHEKRFKRLGMGLIWSDSWARLEAPHVLVELV